LLLLHHAVEEKSVRQGKENRQGRERRENAGGGMRWSEGGALSAARGGVARGEAVPLPSDLFLTSQLALDLALASLRALQSAKRFF